MSKRLVFIPRKYSCSWWLLVVLFCSLAGPLAGAQVASPDPASAQSSEAHGAASEPADSDAVFKESASVRAIGRFLHLSPHGASAAFEYFNFLVLAGAVGFYLVKAVPRAFADRQKKIDQQLVEARTATEQANERLRVVEERLGHLDEEIEQIRRRAESDGAADDERMKQAMEEERRKIVAAAEQEIAAASAVAERSLRKFAAELAMDRAMGRLQLTEQDDRALISDFANGLDFADGRQADGLRERRN